MPIWIIYWDSKCKNTLKTKHLCKVGFIILCYDPTKRPQSTSIELTFCVSKNVYMEKDTRNPRGSSCSRSVWYDWSKSGSPESSITHPVNTNGDQYQRTLLQSICWAGAWLGGECAYVRPGFDPQYKKKSNLLDSLFIC